MSKRVKKHLAFIMIAGLSFLISMCCFAPPVQAMATGSAITLPYCILGLDRELGTVRLYDSDVGIVTGTQITVTLPDGVQFSNDPGTFLISDVVEIPAYYLSSNNTIKTVEYNADYSSAKRLTVTVTEIGAGDGSILDFKFHGNTAVDINNPSDVYVTFRSNDFSVSTSPVLCAVSTGAGTSLTATGKPGVEAGPKRSLASVQISENSAGAIKAGTSFAMKLPQGMKWAYKPEVASTGAISSIVVGDITTDSKGLSTISVRVGSNSVFSGLSSILISNITVDIQPEASDGNIMLTIDGDDQGVSDDEAVIGEKIPAAISDVNPPIENENPELVVDNISIFTVGSKIMTINGISTTVNIAPTIQNGRLLVPLRYLGLALGIPNDSEHVAWDAENSVAILTMRDGRRARCTVGSPLLTFNGDEIAMDVEPLIMEGSILVPVRFLTEAMGGSATWNAEAQSCELQIEY